MVFYIYEKNAGSNLYFIQQASQCFVSVTSNLAKRVYEHKKKLIPGFTLKYNEDYLVYYELFEKMPDAIYREKMIKKKPKKSKIKLIESINPAWNDLSNKL